MRSRWWSLAFPLVLTVSTPGTGRAEEPTWQTVMHMQRMPHVTSIEPNGQEPGFLFVEYPANESNVFPSAVRIRVKQQGIEAAPIDGFQFRYPLGRGKYRVVQVFKIDHGGPLDKEDVARIVDGQVGVVFTNVHEPPPHLVEHLRMATANGGWRVRQNRTAPILAPRPQSVQIAFEAGTAKVTNVAAPKPPPYYKGPPVWRMSAPRLVNVGVARPR